MSVKLTRWLRLPHSSGFLFRKGKLVISILFSACLNSVCCMFNETDCATCLKKKKSATQTITLLEVKIRCHSSTILWMQPSGKNESQYSSGVFYQTRAKREKKTSEYSCRGVFVHLQNSNTFTLTLQSKLQTYIKASDLLNKQSLH